MRGKNMWEEGANTKLPSLEELKARLDKLSPGQTEIESTPILSPEELGKMMDEAFPSDGSSWSELLEKTHQQFSSAK